MATGLPVVALRAMGIEDVLDGDRGGFLVDGSRDDFVKKILLLLEDHNVHEKKSAEAKERAKQFSAGAMAEKLIALYAQVIREKSAKSGKQ
jgi:glycosyltransferase involved in cell wall biosynthesis